MRTASLCAVLALAGGLAAQAHVLTIPKGFDATEGNTNYHPGWDIKNFSTVYYPARTLDIYDTSILPWNTTADFTITKLTARRDGSFITTSTTAHTKDLVVIMSTNNDIPVNNPNWNHFDDNHGANRTEVVGTVATPKTITFPATPPPATGTAPFNVVFTLDKPFTVPANSKNLLIEIRFYKSSVTTGRFRPDAQSWSGTGYNGGRYTLSNTNHCVSPSIFYTSRANTIGSNLGHIWRTSQAPGGKPVIGVAGTKLASAIVIPKTNNCQWWTTNDLIIATATETSGSYALYLDFGKVPRLPVFVGAKIAHQALVIDSHYPLTLGFTRGGVTTIGTGYDASRVFGSQMYSYGSNSSRYVPAVDPDKEVHPRFLFRRVPIFQVN